MSDTDEALDRDGFGEVDPDERPAARRGRLLVATAAVAVIALVIGLVAWQPWSDDDGDAAPTTTSSGAALGAELVIDLPGLTLARSLQGSPEVDESRAQGGFIFAAPGASLETGPFLAFLVDELGRSEPLDNGENTIEIDGHTATVEDGGDTIEVYWEGEPGLRYGVAGAGVGQAQVIAFAESVSFVDGITTVDDPDVIDGMEPAGDINTLFGILGMIQPAFSNDPDVITVEYATEQGDTVTVASIEATDDFTGLAELILEDERVIDVNGSPVVIGTVAATFGLEGEGVQLLLTMRGGRLIGISATADDEGLLALLSGVRIATDEEWAEVLDVIEDPFDNLGGDDFEVIDTVSATELSEDTEP